MDSLTVLRDFTTRGELEKIKLSGDEFLFGDEYHFPCNIETAYRANQGSFYTLESLVFFVKNSHLKHAEYIQQVHSHKLQRVSLPERKTLLDYLESKVASTDAIELVIKPPVEEYHPEEPNFGAQNGFFSKRIRLDEIQEVNQNQNDPPLNYDIEMIKAIEKPLIDREALLECKNKNFESIIEVASKKDEERKIHFQATPGRGVKRSSDDKGFWKDTHDLGIDTTQSFINSRQKDGAKMGYPFSRGTNKSSSSISLIKGCGEGVPIIIVPSASQTLLNMYNAKDFLEDGVYYTPDSKAKDMVKKPECVTIQKKINKDKGVSTFEIRDKPSAFSIEDWSRVVAVFVLGKDWQFKDWPFKDHIEIFNKLIGFYLRFEDDSVESAKVVKQWNVRIISLSKHRRHQDKAAALEIWDRLEEFMRSRRSNSNF
ncbi:hypothetical protein SUGI_0681480 [Cryptomeria japonica]|uniref:protein CDC73 homolog n=1 Tax=Cryptomeria japonica TaxID=3369 RepID=UPI002414BB78|nr:protein CDC73 homolog [Cryptomeria japonica]GLJ33880.1 hypothetical protein SUGI_0681480 [Cryptomeria japonica]